MSIILDFSIFHLYSNWRVKWSPTDFLAAYIHMSVSATVWKPMKTRKTGSCSRYPSCLACISATTSSHRSICLGVVFFSPHSNATPNLAPLHSTTRTNTVAANFCGCQSVHPNKRHSYCIYAHVKERKNEQRM